MNTLTKETNRGTEREAAPQFIAPEVNIFETKDAYFLQAEMPGVSKDGLEITLEANELVITGHKTGDTLNGECLHRESRPLDYRRAFELDPTVDTSQVQAKVEQGLLTIVLPKQERIKPRKIPVL